MTDKTSAGAAPASTTTLSREEAKPRPRVTGRRRGRPKLADVERLNRELLTQALDHFLEKGFEGTTVDAIAGSIGMSKRTVYNRYEDKAALFGAALQGAIEEWLAPLETLPQLETDDVEETLVEVARFIVTTLNSPAGIRLIRITNAESHRMPEIGNLLYHRGHRVISRYLVSLFRRKIFARTTPLPDLEELAGAFLNLMSSPARLIAWGLQSDVPDLEAFVRARVGLFLHGIVPAAKPGI